MNFIKKINKYLLEHYPLIWNTRLIWMLGIGLLTHVLFFLIGYFTIASQQDIEAQNRLENFYFDTSVLFFNVLLSIIILLIWIFYYLQNNAFKGFYRLKKETLFLQFGIVFIIFFINISQYFSFNQGLKLKIRNLYAWEQIDADIKEFNKTNVFLIQEDSNYRLNKKKYPKPFPLEYVSESRRYLGEEIDTTKAFFRSNGGRYYQFYNIDHKLLVKDIKEGRTSKVIITENISVDNKDVKEYLKNNFKYRMVEDLSFYKEDIVACLLNYSGTLYNYGQDSIDYVNRLAYYEELFKRGDEKEIKNNLQSFLNLAKKYKIQHNLNIEDWYALLNDNNYIYNRNTVDKTKLNTIYEIEKVEKKRKNYVVTQFILSHKTEEKDYKNYNYTKNIRVDNRLIDETKRGWGYKNYKEPLEIRTTQTYSKYNEVEMSIIPYCNLGNLNVFFKNVHSSYLPSDHKKDMYFYIFITMLFSLLLFLFKVTDIKTILLSIVSVAALLILIGLIIKYLPRELKDFYGDKRLKSLIVIPICINIIIGSILAFKLKWKKVITAILFSLGIYAVFFALMFLFNFYEASLNADYKSQDALYIWLKEYSFWLTICIWFISIVLYTKAIRKWKGLPE